MPKTQKIIVFTLLICSMMFTSCAAVTGAAIGGALGYGASELFGLDRTGRVLLTAGGAAIGGYAGHNLADTKSNRETDAEKRKILQDTRQMSEPSMKTQEDGTTVVATTYLKTLNGAPFKVFNLVEEFEAPDEKEGTVNRKGVWARDWREAYDDDEDAADDFEAEIAAKKKAEADRRAEARRARRSGTN